MSSNSNDGGINNNSNNIEVVDNVRHGIANDDINNTTPPQQQHQQPILCIPTGEVINAKNTLQSFTGIFIPNTNNTNDTTPTPITPLSGTAMKNDSEQQQGQHIQHELEYEKIEPRLPNGEIINAKNINQSYDHLIIQQQQQQQQLEGNKKNDSNNVIINNNTTDNNSNNINNNTVIAEVIPLQSSIQHVNAELYTSMNRNNSTNDNSNNVVVDEELPIQGTSQQQVNDNNNHNNNNKIIWILVICVIVLTSTIAAGIGVYCGSGNCNGRSDGNLSRSNSNTTSPIQTPPQQTSTLPTNIPRPVPVPVLIPGPVPVPALLPVPLLVPLPVPVITDAPTSPPTTKIVPPSNINNTNVTERELIITAYINNISYINDDNTGSTVTISKYGTTPEDMAMKYIIDSDPIFTNITQEPTEQEAFRLRQRYALYILWFQQYNTLVDTTDGSILWINTDGWLVDPDECNWYGIYCAQIDLGTGIGVQNSVVELIFNFNYMGNNLHGTIPPDLALLSFIQTLNLDDNRMEGTFPISVQRKWTQLLFLETYSNRFSGPISNVLRGEWWPAIQSMDLSYNIFTGSIPDSIQNWTNIEQFILTGNKLSGSLPNWIGNYWSKLRVLSLEACYLSGTIPSSIGLITTLSTFGASFNNFNGTLPALMGQLSFLSYLDLGLCQFTGTIPESFYQCTSMEEFSLSDNYLTGTIPSLIGSSWLILETFGLANNQMIGSLPNNIGNWTLLRRIDIANNFFTGTIPSSIVMWEPSILEIYIYDNLLNGTIPIEFCTSNKTTIVTDCPSEITCNCCTTKNQQCV